MRQFRAIYKLSRLWSKCKFTEIQATTKFELSDLTVVMFSVFCYNVLNFLSPYYLFLVVFQFQLCRYFSACAFLSLASFSLCKYSRICEFICLSQDVGINTSRRLVIVSGGVANIATCIYNARCVTMCESASRWLNERSMVRFHWCVTARCAKQSVTLSTLLCSRKLPNCRCLLSWWLSRLCKEFCRIPH